MQTDGDAQRYGGCDALPPSDRTEQKGKGGENERELQTDDRLVGAQIQANDPVREPGPDIQQWTIFDALRQRIADELVPRTVICGGGKINSGIDEGPADLTVGAAEQQRDGDAPDQRDS